MADILWIADASTLPSPKRQITEEKIIMKAIVVTDQAAGTAGMNSFGAARAAGSDKRRRRSSSCVGIRPD